jgi:hypothetical protein
MIDVEQTILSQFANSPIICALIANMNDYIDPRADLENFFDLIWNVDTAGGDDLSLVGYGLDVWGRIVGVSRILYVPVASPYFGFNEYGAGAVGFHEMLDAGSFSTGVPATDQITLNNGDFRQLILIKALANISGCSIPAMNQLLRNVSGVLGYGDRAYVQVDGTMNISYVFEYPLTATQEAMIVDSGAMLNPAGVSTTLVHT